MKKADKAYKNLDFLNSPMGRSVRILSEFLEPMGRFKREGVRNTIVVFGSARILPRAEAKKRLARAKTQYGRASAKNAKAREALERARIDFDMARYYEDASEFSYLLTKWSNTLSRDRQLAICSGGGPGIMEAANRGAMRGGGRSIGLNISLPFEQGANPYISDNLGFEFHYFFMRKFWFLYPAKGLIMFPGGFGTLDEMMEVLTLVQTGKVTKPMPIILYGREYWNRILNFREMVRFGVISPSDMKLFRFADNPAEAFSMMKEQLLKIYAKKAHIGILHG